MHGDMPGVQYVCLPDAQAVGVCAADWVARTLQDSPQAVLVFPTGNTPLPMYEALRHRPELDWSGTRLFHLDEYVPPRDARRPLPYETYAEYMRRELWDVIDGQKHYFIQDVDEPTAYEARIAGLGGADLVILGIGVNGHIAFNEPGAKPDSPARRVALAPATILSNFKALNKPGYPTHAVTLGLKSILSARHILLLATGQAKQQVVRQALLECTPPDADLPASWLKTHPHVTVLTDFEV